MQRWIAFGLGILLGSMALVASGSAQQDDVRHFFIIRPGYGFDQLRLGESRQVIYNRLGKPLAHSANDGMLTASWYDVQQEPYGNETEVRFRRHESDAAPTVDQIRSECAVVFCLENGPLFHRWETMAHIWSVFPGLTYQESEQTADGTIEWYADADNGVAFEILRTDKAHPGSFSERQKTEPDWGFCQAFIVFAPGTDGRPFLRSLRGPDRTRDSFLHPEVTLGKASSREAP